jgi:hypothetical protein
MAGAVLGLSSNITIVACVKYLVPQPPTHPGVESVRRQVAFVADLAKRTGAKPCLRCKAPMQEVLTIVPVQHEPGLIAYECPSCGYVTSDLTPNRHPLRKQKRDDS